MFSRPRSEKLVFLKFRRGVDRRSFLFPRLWVGCVGPVVGGWLEARSTVSRTDTPRFFPAGVFYYDEDGVGRQRRRVASRKDNGRVAPGEASPEAYPMKGVQAIPMGHLTGHPSHGSSYGGLMGQPG